MNTEDSSHEVFEATKFLAFSTLIQQITRKLCRVGRHAVHSLIILPQVLSLVTNYKNIRIIYLFNTLVVMNAVTVCKAASFGGRATLRLEYDNCAKISAEFATLQSVLPPLEWRRGFMFNGMSMPRYRLLTSETCVPYAILVHRRFRAFGIRERFEGFFSSSEFLVGIDILRKICTVGEVEDIYQSVRCYIDKGFYHVGLAHGDFHSRNMMLDGSLNPKLIDWDCVRFKGVQEFDALYFILEREWSLSRRPWYETILEYVVNGPDSQSAALMEAFDIRFQKQMATAFFIDRIGQEAGKFDFHYPAHQLHHVIRGLSHSIH